MGERHKAGVWGGGHLEPPRVLPNTHTSPTQKFSEPLPEGVLQGFLQRD